MDTNEKLNLLKNKLESLQIRQNKFQAEIHQLRKEIAALETPAVEADKPAPETMPEAIPEQPDTTTALPEAETAPARFSLQEWFSKDNLEAFIGGNLINKIGILITIIGVAIGAKYSIDNNLVSPLTRIVLGYIFGTVMLATALKLRAKYETYSAVLLSGALAILYFITFFGYSVYELYPQLIAFGLMALFTAFTVVAALSYNQQIIAIIGLTGAYGIPFLLSNDSGNPVALFSYICLINIGILILSFKKYWKLLFYIAFVLSWLIFSFWFVVDYSSKLNFSVAATFLPVFFLTFYITFLAYKIIRKENFNTQDAGLILTNSFLFFGFGYAALETHATGKNFTGFFTLLNAIIHFAVGFFIYQQKQFDKNLFYLVAGLVLVFITIAIPIQLDGNWVTLLWGAEAALLFWLGRTRQVLTYEKLAYPLILLAFASLFQDYHFVYNPNGKAAFFNRNFFSGLFVSAAFGFITWLNFNKNFKNISNWKRFTGIILPVLFIFTLFHTFYFEIDLFWQNQFKASRLESPETGRFVSQNYDLNKFGVLSIFNYALFFFTTLAFVNLKFIKNKTLAFANIALLVVFIVSMLSNGLLLCSELRESYLERASELHYNRGIMYLAIRYICFGFIAAACLAIYRYLKSGLPEKDFNVPFALFIHLVILWITSSELLHWMDIFGSQQSDKLALSILWGCYALLLVGLGIWKKFRYFRIAGIVLFGITLVKLFFYDLAHLNNLSKTIVLVSLGVLLLIISFLYNKYNDVIDDKVEN